MLDLVRLYLITPPLLSLAPPQDPLDLPDLLDLQPLGSLPDTWIRFRRLAPLPKPPLPPNPNPTAIPVRLKPSQISRGRRERDFWRDEEISSSFPNLRLNFALVFPQVLETTNKFITWR